MASRVFIGYINDEPAVFASILPQPGSVKNLFRISRVVVLPDFQGLGLSHKIHLFCGEIYTNINKKISAVSTHPAIIKSYYKDPKWILTNFNDKIHVEINFNKATLNTRIKASFRYKK